MRTLDLLKKPSYNKNRNQYTKCTGSYKMFVFMVILMLELCYSTGKTVYTRPISFYGFALFVVLSLFTAGYPNAAGRIFLTTLEEPPVKRERITNDVKSWNGTCLVYTFALSQEKAFQHLGCLCIFRKSKTYIRIQKSYHTSLLLT